jgi:hypothetical protein
MINTPPNQDERVRLDRRAQVLELATRLCRLRRAFALRPHRPSLTRLHKSEGLIKAQGNGPLEEDNQPLILR